MATAAVHVAEVGGFPGPARCYKIDPPYRGHSYVTIWVQPSFGQHQLAEVAVVAATATGAGAGPSVKRLPGSQPAHEDYTPGDVVYEDGLRQLALGTLGGYAIVSPE